MIKQYIISLVLYLMLPQTSIFRHRNLIRRPYGYGWGRRQKRNNLQNNEEQGSTFHRGDVFKTCWLLTTETAKVCRVLQVRVILAHMKVLPTILFLVMTFAQSSRAFLFSRRARFLSVMQLARDVYQSSGKNLKNRPSNM